MPAHLPAHNRRQFLATVGAGLIACSSRGFAGDVDDELVYLLNDTHIGEKHPPHSPVPTHLRQVVTELVEMSEKPAAVLINGDLALHDGQPGDYRHFAKLVAPLRDVNVDVHVTLGNHDNREAFYDVLEEERPADPPVESRHISVVSTPHANFFLLDSLTKTLVTPGTLGEQQRQWLAEALDAHADRPAIIVAHHNPRLGGDPLHFPGGLVDSQELWQLLADRRHVKAYVHGHVHDRTYAAHEGIHIINTPATSYVADPAKSTTGWTVARLRPDGITLTTRTTDPLHPWNGEQTTLTWRN
ncbi:3',5'-cyclic adenosine monophosphate phosphodiesterase CpdA [Maioricimonas rarisocia]|uniref:3',5'-cyclic adenosine monophosphate phosphodiesterase CpdA n=1 Tax=Maioricimonas rarisocia TaxID=2528026 RepID=A0A517ZEJ5_9PLAN|nr:metallophosphoesterase [Maioricimonas rarisocia]QDU40888.1 3',5'-cyclic adenosine monophosphate phosphodiesterase CpdA [Maioricimonas rarisocia]